MPAKSKTLKRDLKRRIAKEVSTQTETDAADSLDVINVQPQQFTPPGPKPKKKPKEPKTKPKTKPKAKPAKKT
jgi:hypothetical protein